MRTSCTISLYRAMDAVALPLLDVECHDVTDNVTVQRQEEPAVAPLRWLILLTFSLVSAQQQLGWVMPGAVQPNLTAQYGFSEQVIQVLEAYGCIFFIAFAVPSAFALDRLGLRAPVLACVFLMLACSSLRLLAVDGSLLSVISFHAAMILDAIVGPVVMAAPTKLAEDWFPPSERTVATAIAALSNQCGGVLIYVLVPLLCPDASSASLRRLNWALFGLSAANAAMAVAYFPSHPHRAPSASAVFSRAGEASVTLRSLAVAWRAFFCIPAYLCIVLVYSLVVGAANPQSALLEPGLANLGASEATAGWVNAGAQLASLIVGVAVSAGVDALKARARWLHKAALVGATAAAGLLYLCYAIAFVMPAASAGSSVLTIAIASFVAANAAMGAAIPLYFDAAAEHVFGRAPAVANEGAMLMGLVLPLNVAGLLVLLSPASVFFSWINWGTAGLALIGAAALTAFVPSKLDRYDFDVAAVKAARKSDALARNR